MTRTKALLALAGLTLFSGTASAETTGALSSGQDFSLSGGIGLMNIDAGEFVYDGDYKISQLDWQSRGVVLFTLGAEAELSPDYLLKAKIDTGIDGDGDLTDYDWLMNGPNGMNDWTDRSRHPDTGLDHYYAGALEIYRRMWADDSSELQLGGGFKYTDVKWSASGGSYVYSDNAFRDSSGSFADGQRIISYRMQLPVAYASVAASRTFGSWTLDGDVKAGLSFGIDDTDDHWGRQRRFFDRMDPAPMIGVDLRASYAMTEDTSFYLGGSFEQIFKSEGSSKEINTATGNVESLSDGAGANYRAVNLTFGLKRQF